MSVGCRHPDFAKIHAAFLAHYSKDPKLGESRYADWVKASELDDSQSYYAQGAARAAGVKQSFEWAKFLLEFVKEDKDSYYYKVEALFPVESMNNGPPFTRDEVLQSARSLTGKPSDLNHDLKQVLAGVEIVAAQCEDDCVECLVRVPKKSQLVGMIDRKEIVNVSIEGEWSHGVPGHGLVLTGLGWLTKASTLPGIPLTRIMPVERIAESFVVPVPAVEERTITKIGSCVGCGGKADYLVSACKACFGKFSAGAGGSAPSAVMSSLELLPVREVNLFVREAAGDLPSDFTAFKMRFQALGANPCARCEALDGKEFVYGTEPELPLHPNCQCSYQMVERLHVHLNLGVENLEEKEMDKIAEKIALKLGDKSREFEKQKIELAEAQTKVTEAEGKLGIAEAAKAVAEGACAEATGKLGPVAEKLAAVEKTLGERNVVLEKFKKCMPGIELLADPPVMMPVVESLASLQRCMPLLVAERSTPGMERQGAIVRSEILKAQKRLQVK
jgi:hypothetical protein